MDRLVVRSFRFLGNLLSRWLLLASIGLVVLPMIAPMAYGVVI